MHDRNVLLLVIFSVSYDLILSMIISMKKANDHILALNVGYHQQDKWAKKKPFIEIYEND